MQSDWRCLNSLQTPTQPHLPMHTHTEGGERGKTTPAGHPAMHAHTGREEKKKSTHTFSRTNQYNPQSSHHLSSQIKRKKEEERTAPSPCQCFQLVQTSNILDVDCVVLLSLSACRCEYRIHFFHIRGNTLSS